MVLVNFRTVQSKLYKIDLPANANISQAKEEMSKELAGSDPSKMKMIYKSKILNNNVPISSLNLGRKDFIVVNAPQPKPKPAEKPAPEPQPESKPIPTQAPPVAPKVPDAQPLPVAPEQPKNENSFEDGLQKLTDIGFDPELSLRALRATGGNVDQAAEMIITGEIKNDDDNENDEDAAASQMSEDELEHDQMEPPDEGIASPQQAQIPESLTGLSPDQAAETLLLALPKEEQDAIRRLQQLGNFNLLEVIQVYHACDKNEELAANILLSNLY